VQNAETETFECVFESLNCFEDFNFFFLRFNDLARSEEVEGSIPTLVLTQYIMRAQE